MHSTRCPDIALHRSMLASIAYESLHVQNSDRTWILWLDSDVSIDKAELWLLFEDSVGLIEALPGLNPSVSARYLTKLSGRLAATRAPNQADVTTACGKMQPVYSGLGCFLSTTQGFRRHCQRSSTARIRPDSDAEMFVVCSSGVVFGADNHLSWRTEDWSYCAAEWEDGAVYLSRARARHSRLLLNMPDELLCVADATPPEAPADTQVDAAKPPEPDAAGSTP
ncbi:MAG TPA: hypothetical protein VJ553_04390 [Candidatus Paceibacterota bacterium]|nr:hypothetical protein [Candidatus Paceibacterota bacterium]